MEADSAGDSRSNVRGVALVLMNYGQFDPRNLYGANFRIGSGGTGLGYGGLQRTVAVRFDSPPPSEGEVSTVTLSNVAANTNIYLAGRSQVPTPSVTAAPPCASAQPVTALVGQLPTQVPFEPASRTVTFDVSSRLTAGSDGDLAHSVCLAAADGLSSYCGPNAAVVGVFLGSNMTNWQSASELPTYSAAYRAQMTVHAPALGQVFYIGDGYYSDVDLTSYVVPAGAERLFVGLAYTRGTSGKPTCYGDLAASRLTVIYANALVAPDSVSVAVGGEVPASSNRTLSLPRAGINNTAWRWASGSDYAISVSYMPATRQIRVSARNLDTGAQVTSAFDSVDVRSILGCDPDSCCLAYIGWSSSTTVSPAAGLQGVTMGRAVIRGIAYNDTWPSLVPPLPPDVASNQSTIVSASSMLYQSSDEASVCGGAGCAWVLDPWAPCDVTCGIGSINRYIGCHKGNGTGPRVSDSWCSVWVAKPAESYPCEAKCSQYRCHGFWATPCGGDSPLSSNASQLSGCQAYHNVNDPYWASDYITVDRPSAFSANLRSGSRWAAFVAASAQEMYASPGVFVRIVPSAPASVDLAIRYMASRGTTQEWLRDSTSLSALPLARSVALSEISESSIVISATTSAGSTALLTPSPSASPQPWALGNLSQLLRVRVEVVPFGALSVSARSGARTTFALDAGKVKLQYRLELLPSDSLVGVVINIRLAACVNGLNDACNAAIRAAPEWVVLVGALLDGTSGWPTSITSASDTSSFAARFDRNTMIPSGSGVLTSLSITGQDFKSIMLAAPSSSGTQADTARYVGMTVATSTSAAVELELSVTAVIRLRPGFSSTWTLSNRQPALLALSIPITSAQVIVTALAPASAYSVTLAAAGGPISDIPFYRPARVTPSPSITASPYTTRPPFRSTSSTATCSPTMTPSVTGSGTRTPTSSFTGSSTNLRGYSRTPTTTSTPSGTSSAAVTPFPLPPYFQERDRVDLVCPQCRWFAAAASGSSAAVLHISSGDVFWTPELWITVGVLGVGTGLGTDVTITASAVEYLEPGQPVKRSLDPGSVAVFSQWNGGMGDTSAGRLWHYSWLSPGDGMPGSVVLSAASTVASAVGRGLTAAIGQPYAAFATDSALVSVAAGPHSISITDLLRGVNTSDDADITSVGTRARLLKPASSLEESPILFSKDNRGYPVASDDVLAEHAALRDVHRLDKSERGYVLASEPSAVVEVPLSEGGLFAAYVEQLHASVRRDYESFYAVQLARLRAKQGSREEQTPIGKGRTNHLSSDLFTRGRRLEDILASEEGPLRTTVPVILSSYDPTLLSWRYPVECALPSSLAVENSVPCLNATMNPASTQHIRVRLAPRSILVVALEPSSSSNGNLRVRATDGSSVMSYVAPSLTVPFSNCNYLARFVTLALDIVNGFGTQSGTVAISVAGRSVRADDCST